MIVGCYTLDLYCERIQSDPAGHVWDAMNNPWQYTGRSRAQCIRQARADGWKIAGDKCYCPVCVRNKEPQYR